MLKSGQARTQTRIHTHFLFKAPLFFFCEYLNLDKRKAAASIEHIPTVFKCKVSARNEMN